MTTLQLLRREARPTGRALHSQIETNYCRATASRAQAGREQRLVEASGCRLSWQKAGKQAVSSLLYASLLAVTGCATSAELESLRAEVAKANAAAARAEAGVSSAQRQLAALKESSEPSSATPEMHLPEKSGAPRVDGYKWGRLK